MKKYNYIVSAVMAAVAGFIFYETSSYKIGKTWQKNPAMWPHLLAILLLILAVALVIETILKKETAEEKERSGPVIDWKSPGMTRVYIMVGLMLGFCLLMKLVGMLLALLVLIPCIELLMGCKSKLMLIVLPVALVLFCYVFFVVIMKITLPQPIWA